MRLAVLHRRTQPDESIRVRLPPPAQIERLALLDILTGAGFEMRRRQRARPTLLTRLWTLPDTTGAGMRLLISGLNPSPAAADAGIGFARPGNRFWPAALAAGLVTRDRDPDHALRAHGVGMTDVVKRTTRKASELSPDEYAAGLARLERTVARLQPRAICFVGLAAWRSACDRHAAAGWQDASLGGTPVYLMPSTSGLNASSTLDSLTEHLRLAGRPPAV